MTRRQDLQDRLQRAASWIKAAAGLSPDENHERFIFYYIALNAMYGRRQYEGDRSEVWQDIDRFVNQVKRMWASSGERSGNLLLAVLQDRHVDALILDYFLLDDLFKGATREKLVGRCTRDLVGAKLKFRSGDPFAMLRTILHRLTVLRNRVMHGCVTYGSVSKGLPSVVKGARVARDLVPALYELMAMHGPVVKWDPIPYPRVGFEDPQEKLDAE
jgi:hypothetical protein